MLYAILPKIESLFISRNTDEKLMIIVAKKKLGKYHRQLCINFYQSRTHRYSALFVKLNQLCLSKYCGPPLTLIDDV